MGSPFYSVGEQKVRPGVYKRYENVGSNPTPGAIYGVFAYPVHANNGPVGTVTEFTKDDIEDFKAMYGTGGTTDGVLALFEGGATKVFVYRLGTGGTPETFVISESETSLITISTKYPTEEPFKVTIKSKLGTTGVKQLLLHNGTELMETIEFLSGEKDSADLVDAINLSSKYLKATKTADGSVPTISGSALSDGENPTVSNSSYADAFVAFEPFKWNHLVLDTVDTDVHATVKSYIDRIFEEGAMGVCMLGENRTSEGALIPFETRKTHAASFDDEKIIYFGSGYVDSYGNEVDGYLAVAKQAGIIGSLSSKESGTHTVVPGAVGTLETLKNSQYEQAIKNGMILLSPNSAGQVWFDSAVNTLMTLRENQDDGWKKIRRTSTRFELFDRIDRNVEPLIGKVNCDDIGIGDVVIAGQAIIDEMIKEGKLKEGGKFEEDTSMNRGSDYAFFVISVDDLDSLEKIYLRYQFRFVAE